MNLTHSIAKLRVKAGLSQAQFAETIGVSQQAVQKWEKGTAIPNLEKIVLISKRFDVPLDELVMGNGNRIVEGMNGRYRLKPQYQDLHDWEFYSSNLLTEYKQSIEEGLDVEKYRELFFATALLPKNEIKKRLGDVLFDIVLSAPKKEDYKYVEPSDLEQIKNLRTNQKEPQKLTYDENLLERKIHGSWLGRICGCMLGKPIEGIRTNELIPFLKQTGNYPLHRYILRSDLNDEIIKKYCFGFKGQVYADEIDGMPADDDTNYILLAQQIIEDNGKNFTPSDVATAWLKYQNKNAYCTAERVAYCNFIKGFYPPESAVYKNPYREWIGAQIRGDYFGYINPGNPELAAEMAWRDANISHVKNGIYGEMFVSAMLAVAATTNDIENIIAGGLAQIPHTSRLHEAITAVIENFKNETSQERCFKLIHDKFNEHEEHCWCHTIPNAMIVTAALLYGKGDYEKSICMAVQTGFDTDCNGATVGSVLGMANGVDGIPKRWSAPINDVLHSTVFGVGTVKISDRVKLTLKHVKN